MSLIEVIDGNVDGEQENTTPNNYPIPGLEEGYVEIKEKISSDLVWVRVLDKQFFFMQSDNSVLGIKCQTTSSAAYDSIAGNGGMESFSLLKKDSGGWKTLIAMALNTSKKFVGEFRQQGNQFVGSQSVYGVSGSKAADLFFSFMEKHFSNISKYSSDINSLSYNSGYGHGYAYDALKRVMLSQTERFREYTYNVPSVNIDMRGLIVNTLGEDFFVSKKSIQETFDENKLEFFKMIPEFLKTKREELSEFIKNINILEFYKDETIRPHILKSLPFLMNYISSQSLSELFANINIHDLFSGGTDSFKELMRLMSLNGGESKKILFKFLDENFTDIVNYLGGKGIGLGKLINMLKRPKLDVHKEAKINPDTGGFEIEREETVNGVTRKVKKKIADDILILSSKEIRALLERHKDEIKDFFSAPGKDADIEYLRFFIQHLHEGQSEAQLNGIKEKFIEYYNKKFDNGTSDYPGKILFDSLMNQLKFKLGKKTKRKSFNFKEEEEEDTNYNWRYNAEHKSPHVGLWAAKSKTEYPFDKNIRIPDMSQQDMSSGSFVIYLLKYFYKNLKEKFGKLEVDKNGTQKFVNTKKEETKQALSDFLYMTAALNGIEKSAILHWLNLINSNFIQKGKAEGDQNKYKIPSPTPGIVSWANKESLYKEEEPEDRLDEAAIRNYIKNKILESWEN